MKNIFSSHYWRTLTRGSRWAALLLAAPLAASAANPTLRIQALGSPSGAPDVTAFVDQVEIVRVSDGMVMAGAVANSGFETNGLVPGAFSYNTAGASWTFNNRSGISRNGSGFGSTAPQGDAVAFLQSQGGLNGLADQTLALADGLYQVRFVTAQRNCCGGLFDQRLNVLINGTSVGTIQPPSNLSYVTFTSNTFAVGTPNNALAFDGIDDEARTSGTAPAFGAGNFTLETWVRTGTASTNPFVALGSVGGNDYWLGMLNGRATVSVSGTACTGTTLINDNRWHHLAGVRNGTQLTIYVDGTAQTTITNGLGARECLQLEPG